MKVTNDRSRINAVAAICYRHFQRGARDDRKQRVELRCQGDGCDLGLVTHFCNEECDERRVQSLAASRCWPSRRFCVTVANILGSAVLM